MGGGGLHPLAPLHNPANIIGIEACRAVLGHDVPQVAVFDTAFHQTTMPEHAYLYPSPMSITRRTRSAATASMAPPTAMCLPCGRRSLGKDPAELKVVSCHLGNGSSLAAVKGGRRVDTSMGLTPGGPAYGHPGR